MSGLHDQAMVASTEAGLQKLMESLSNKCMEYDMKIHVDKTKVMKISRKQDWSIQMMFVCAFIDFEKTFNRVDWD